MPGTYYDPTASYAGGGLDRELGENIPAALWQRLMDMLEFITGGSGTWTSFIPTLTQGVGVAITVNQARYKLNGTSAKVIVGVTVAASGTSGVAIALTAIPAAIAPAVTSASGIYTIGVATLYTGAGNFRHAAVVPYGPAEFRFIIENAGVNFVGNTPSLQMVSGGHLSLALSYEIA